MLGGRYRLEEQIGRGGMSVVYRAFDARLSRAVAVKVVASAAAEDRSFQERFRRETQMLAALNHPGIATVYDAGQDGDQHFLVMEYLPWPTLRQILSSEAPLSAARAENLAGQLADALATAHRDGLVHCDVKPENVLIGPDDRVKLVDFGIAQAATATGVWDRQELWGTAAYLAPEQVEGQAVDGRTDVYALGLVLYELLTGELPFQGRTPAEVALARVTQNPPPLASLPSSASDSLCRVIERCLERLPEERYQSMDDLRAALLETTSPPLAQVHPLTESVTPSRRDPETHNAPTMLLERHSAEPVPRRPRVGRRIRLIALGPLVLGLIVLVGLIAASAMPVSGPATPATPTVAVPEQEVPNLLGLTTTEAQMQAAELGLIAAYDEPRHAVEMPAGRIVEQRPRPNTRVREGTTISLTLSLGPQLVVVPNLIGQEQSDAKSLLEKQNLQFGVVKSTQSQARTGTIIEQSPPAGQAVAPGTSVDLVLSSGMPVRVPRVIGLSRKDAEKALRSGNLEVGEVRQTQLAPNSKRDKDKDDDNDKGMVIVQTPLPGASVAAGSRVDLVVLN